MPKYRVTDPDSGKTLELTGDSPPSEQELNDIFGQFQPVEVKNRFEGTGESQAAKLGIGSAVNDAVETFQRVGQRAGEAIGVLGPDDRERQEQRLTQDDEFRDELKELPGFSRGRLVGQVGLGSVIPGGVAGGVAKRLVTGAAGGAVGNAVTTGPGESIGENAALGATIGAIAPFAVNAVASVVRRIAGRRINPVNDSGELSDEVLDLLEQNRVSPESLAGDVSRQLEADGVLNADEAARFNLFQEVLGESPTRAQATRSASDFQTQQELTKGSGAINDKLAQQDAGLGRAVDDQIQSTGSTAVRQGEEFEPIVVGESVQQAVLRPQLELDAEISDLYRAARESGAPGEGVSAARLSALSRRYEGQDRISGGVTSAVRSELSARGIINAEGAVVGRVTVNDAEELRIAINTLHQSASPRGRQLIREFKEALDDDVMSFAGEDIFSQARQARRRFSARMERGRLSKFDASSKSIVKDILENKLEADDILKKVSSATTKRADLDQLVTFLRQNGGEQAVSDLKAGVLSELLQKATSSNTRNSADGAIFNGNSFAKAIRSFNGQGGKLRGLFSADELRQLNKIREVGELRIPVQGTQQGLGPSAAAIRGVGAKLLEAIPGANILSGLAAQGRNIAAERSALLPQRELINALRRPARLRSAGAAGSLADSESGP